MRKTATIILVLTGLFFICSGISRAQGVGLLGVLFKLQGMRDQAAADMRGYENEIQRCNNTIMKAEQIMGLARQKGNLEAERVAREALTKAKKARQKNQDMKDEAGSRKKRADIVYAHVHNLLSRQTSTNSQVKSVVMGSHGNAFILSKRLNQTIPLGEDRAGFLEPGDEIWTLGNSSAELLFLDGRGALKLGEYSKFKIEEDSQGTQIINMLKGKIHIAVDKIDDYQKMMQERMKKAQKGYRSTSLLWPLLPGFEFRTSGFSGAVRGTKFLVFEDEKAGTELIVLEGVVDVKATKGEKSIPVAAGYRIQATKDGVISKPEKIDLKKIKRWWEK